MKKYLLLSITFLTSSVLFSQADTTKETSSKTEKQEKSNKWYDTFSIRGYGHIRYNRLLETNPDLRCEQCDKSWGDNNGIYIRRMRMILMGRLHPQFYFYFQTDFANNASSGSATGQHFAQIRDLYFDWSFDKEHVYRLRVGQSKVPYGFDNLQSSQTRLSLDRSDALNSGAFNERDMGVFFYYTPKKITERYKKISDDNLKGSGNYGVFGIGVYNGQTANKAELNNELHVAARLTYPFKIKKQILELSLMGYTGQYVMPKDLISTGVKTNASLGYTDKRAAGSFILYPKPFGIQAEYTVGVGPRFNKDLDSIEVAPLKGGYITLSYIAKIKDHVLIPFARYQYYDGGKKLERDARSYVVSELDFGIEWTPIKYLEMTMAYTISERRYEDFLLQDNFQVGSLLRLQAQLSF